LVAGFQVSTEVHPLMPVVLLRMTGLRAFDLDPEPSHQTASLLNP
jgi:hypothetical protein